MSLTQNLSQLLFFFILNRIATYERQRKRKPQRNKLQIREKKTRRQHIGLAVTVAFLIAVALLVNSLLDQKPPTETTPLSSNPKAAIVDHLSLTRPNQTFIDSVTNLFDQAGFLVDYYPGENVTVECYKYLPAHNYDIILFRVHSAGASASGSEEVQLFTSEPYSSTKYVYHQLSHQLGIVKYSATSAKTYFGICSGFVQRGMVFKFTGTVIIMMGCDGLAGTQMAEAFVEKGASLYLGWTDSISGSRNDPAIKHLIQRLIIEKQTVKEAVADTMSAFPPSSMDNSELLYYPPDVGNQNIQIMDVCA